MSIVNYRDANLCAQFSDNLQARQARLEPDVYRGLQEFVALSGAGAYGDADKALASIRDKVALLEDGSELFEQAGKIQKAAGSLLVDYRKTNNSGERWLATYLNDLNRATLVGDRDDQKTAIQNIWHIQKQLKPESAARYQELCNARIQEVDSDGSMRHELTTWSGYLKAGAIDIAKPVGSVAVGLGALYIFSRFVFQPIDSGITSGITYMFGNEVAQATSVNFVAIGTYRSAKAFIQRPSTQTLIPAAVSAYVTYNRLMALYTQLNPAEEPAL